MIDFEEILAEIAEEGEETTGFRIDSDVKAEWALSKIRAEHEETERLVHTAQQMVEFYTAKIKEYVERRNKRCDGLTAMLEQYFNTVQRKATKTKETYELPTAKLVRKHHEPKIDRDDAAIVSWMEQNASQYVKVSTSPDWSRFKKESGGKLVNGEWVLPDGEVVPGITSHDQPDTFDLEWR